MHERRESDPAHGLGMALLLAPAGAVCWWYILRAVYGCFIGASAVFWMAGAI